MEKSKYELVGLIPAAGYASRISPLPCSKEIIPIKFSNSSNPKVAATYLIESFEIANVKQSYFIIRQGKWDIPEYYREGSDFNIDFAYIVIDPTDGTLFSIDKAYPFVQNHRVAFGFPDILFKPRNAFVKLLEKQNHTNADIVLGLFPADDPSKMDMVELNEEECIKNIIVKPKQTNLKYTWIIAVWAPSFMSFLHTYLSSSEFKKNKLINTDSSDNELYLGELIVKALNSGLTVETVTFPKGTYLDIGTPEDLKKILNLNF